jgi:hypothetical protein
MGVIDRVSTVHHLFNGVPVIFFLQTSKHSGASQFSIECKESLREASNAARNKRGQGALPVLNATGGLHGWGPTSFIHATTTPFSPLTRRTLLDVGVPGLPIGIGGQRFLQQQSSSLSYTQQLHPLNSRRGGSSSISARTTMMLTLSLDLLVQ